MTSVEAGERRGARGVRAAGLVVLAAAACVAYEGYATAARNRMYTRQWILLERARPRVAEILAAGDDSASFGNRSAIRDAIVAEAREEGGRKASESLRVMPRLGARTSPDADAEMLAYFSLPRYGSGGFMCLMEKDTRLQSSRITASKTGGIRTAKEFVAIADAMWDAADAGDSDALSALAGRVADSDIFVGIEGVNDDEVRFSGMQLKMLAATLGESGRPGAEAGHLESTESRGR